MTEPYYADDSVTVHHGDCLDVLAELPDASVDAVCTDPPYGIVFMGRKWDDHVDGETFQAWCKQWATECLRVLKPGGHLLAFGGTRTWHRLACAVEDAGFEIRDSIAWLYGSGFPKSLDVSKAIDKARNDKADVLAVTSRLAGLASAAGITRNDIDTRMGTSDMGGWWLSTLLHRCACPSVENWTRLRDIIPGAAELDAEVWRLNGRKGTPGEAWEQRPIITERTMTQGGGTALHLRMGEKREVEANVTAPATDDAHTWQGWGTALKPAFEPIVVARKPLAAGSVAGNVLQFGTGALNIDACRVGTDLMVNPAGGIINGANNYIGDTRPRDRDVPPTVAVGRWPANVTLDPTQAAELDRQSGTMPARGNTTPTRQCSPEGVTGWGRGRPLGAIDPGDSGGASRFFKIVSESPSDLVFLPVESSSCGDESTADASTSAGRSTKNRSGSSPTDGNGSRHTDPSLPGTRSTTGTTTPSTTPSTTSCVSPPNGTTITTTDSVSSTGGLMESSTVAASGVTPTNRPAPSPSDEPGPSTATAESALRRTAANGSPATGTSSTPDDEPSGHTDSTPDRFFPTFHYEPKAPTHERPRIKRDGAGESRVLGKGLSDQVRECNVCGNRTIGGGNGREPNCGHGDFTFVPTTARDEHTAHPTVKPLDLMRWLTRLVTPPGGTVLDPFAGSGTTAEACVVEGFRCITVEREADYLPLIVARLTKPIQVSLFGDDPA